jgi:hypothetical protein
MDFLIEVLLESKESNTFVSNEHNTTYLHEMSQGERLCFDARDVCV